MNRFNIRVYGIYLKDGQLLVTDEIRFGMKMTKLPGGGLEFGEGLAAALKREWQEEMKLEIEVGDIFYVNPFLQISAFKQTDEVLCHYFWVRPLEPFNVPITEKAFDFETDEDDQQRFRWISLAQLTEESFTFPIDRSMVPKLKAYILDKKLQF
ncbi:MAG: NUDIX domain-containing protein [Bacteroidota bacterium]